ncbi:type III-B CRISPR-associated protein Cas10/Cmr2, partial [Synechocystis salina LEGE 06155]|nr:type III-B CRISPR-associated protein Cas10/Cmr2 [Synechocystis salina LEGE 06155]
PVQDFIKASRKFIDFWASSYLLHYLSARLCWKIAQEYGPDAVITPSLWGQEIIDAFIAEEFQFHSFFNNQDPAKLFNEQYSTALSTAGFPNVITALIPGKARAIALGKMLKETLQKEWETIAYKVRDTVKKTIIDWANNDSKRQKFWDKYKASFPSLDPCPFQKELAQLKQGGCWEWNNLWEAQIKHTWEFYFVAVPLGSPEKPLTFSLKQSEDELQSWSQAQEKIAKSPAHPIPLDCEKALYQESQIGMLNVGSWWGSFQTQLARMIQAIKNTRSWQIPVAPGERSSISGFYSALHFRFQYQGKFQQGRGLPAGSIRLFWLVMAENFPGLFNGSERLNAIELTKRMAWSYGGLTEMLGINSLLNTNPSEHQSADYDEQGQIITPLPDYEAMIRFPNLCSIAAARVMHDYPNLVKRYCNCLLETLKQETILSKQDLKLFQNYTSRPSKIWQVDQTGQRFNGVMFSSKWLADNIGLDGEKQVLPKDTNIRKDKLQALRLAVDKAHTTIGFDKDSPADWWALVLGDGDSMGKYVSGSRLKRYADYLVPDAIAIEHQQNEHWQELLNIKKRMGPATHVGLNRALLDFSNRLVPYLTEKRCCGRVIFSGGDDVMVALPVIELPKFLASLRAAWCGEADPIQKFETNPSMKFTDQGGFWTPNYPVDNIKRPFFTMG